MANDRLFDQIATVEAVCNQLQLLLWESLGVLMNNSLHPDPIASIRARTTLVLRLLEEYKQKYDRELCNIISYAVRDDEPNQDEWEKWQLVFEAITVICASLFCHWVFQPRRECALWRSLSLGAMIILGSRCWKQTRKAKEEQKARRRLHSKIAELIRDSEDITSMRNINTVFEHIVMELCGLAQESIGQLGSEDSKAVMLRRFVVFFREWDTKIERLDQQQLLLQEIDFGMGAFWHDVAVAEEVASGHLMVYQMDLDHRAGHF
ncbi:hypothetical protein QBC38DRAFT_446081 [Podospora fimiseda]|uniref:Uncharacterized protein n=1 Tax=Podospora fimiseda TaxID=252190 RepID=A0AAN7BKF5_9PEZI|nr:hypothetical protein QBC38DRAFT_446081 [Podospora fimiseda]